MAHIWIPSLMKTLTDGVTSVELEGGTVAVIVQNLDKRFPRFSDRVCDDGKLKTGLVVSVDGVICPEGLRAPVEPESEVHFLPSISGG